VIFTIALRELKTLFISPLAWAMLAVVQVILAFMFLAHIEEYLLLQPQLLTIDNAPGVTDLVVGRLFGSAAIVLLLAVPLLTMRLISDERRNRTLSLLFSAPISMTEIVLGKFLGCVSFLGLLLLLITLMPLSLFIKTIFTQAAAFGSELPFASGGGKTQQVSNLELVGACRLRCEQHPFV